MTLEEKKAAVNRLAEIIPALGKYYPPEFVDFRNPTPFNWRGGCFVRAKSEWESPCAVVDEDPTKLEFKALFGCEAAARLVAARLLEATRIAAEIFPGDHYWSVKMSIPEAEICW